MKHDYAISKEFTFFIEISAGLCGVDTDVLYPPLEPEVAAIARLYFSLIEQGIPRWVEWIEEYVSLREAGVSYAEAVHRLLANEDGTPRDDVCGTVSRMTMYMWLFGNWNGATEVADFSTSQSIIEVSDIRDYVVSSAAYGNGWIWRVAQAHPMGISQFDFGSWGQEPPSLTDYGFKV